MICVRIHLLPCAGSCLSNNDGVFWSGSSGMVEDRDDPEDAVPAGAGGQGHGGRLQTCEGVLVL